MKLLAEIKLHRPADAAETLSQLRAIDMKGLLTEYAQMAYDIETGSEEVAVSLEKVLARNYANAFYYLAKYLARQGKTEEAKSVILRLNKKAYTPMADKLLRKITAAQEESE